MSVPRPHHDRRMQIDRGAVAGARVDDGEDHKIEVENDRGTRLGDRL
jgi:hypothetical protein